MTTTLRRWLPEAMLIAVGLYFFCRELGTFPAAWADDSIFMLVAKSLAEGHGYALTILGRAWEYPHFLHVGPTAIVPAALAIKLFGFSVAAARIPQAGYLIATSVALFVYTQKIAGRDAARFGAALLITLSAFVNTGKPLLGEIPAFFFLLLALLSWEKAEKSLQWAAITGLLFGIAAVTKLTFALVLPALGVAALAALLRKDRNTVRMTAVMGTTMMLVFLPWKLFEISHVGGIVQEISTVLFGHDAGAVAVSILDTPAALLRTPYIAFGVFLVLGGNGLWQKRKSLPQGQWLFLAALIALFIVYFLVSDPWYRKLLPAHLLLLAFVPDGTFALVGKRLTAAVLTVIILAQGYWQFDHRGSSASTEGADATAALEERFADKDLMIQQLEVFVRLPENPHWLLLLPEHLTARLPADRTAPDDTQKCLPLLRKMSQAEQDARPGRITQVAGRYVIIDPPDTCSR